MTRQRNYEKYKLEKEEQAKICPDCGIKKNYEYYGTNKAAFDKLAHYCLLCAATRSRDCQKKITHTPRPKATKQPKNPAQPPPSENKDASDIPTLAPVVSLFPPRQRTQQEVEFLGKITEIETALENLAIYFNNLNNRIHVLEKANK